MKKFSIAITLLELGFLFGINYSKIKNMSELDEYYSKCLKTVKSGLLYGSSADSKESLENYEDRLELYMHLNGYNGAEMTRMKCNAIIEVSKEQK